MEDSTVLRLEHSKLLKLLQSDLEIQMKFLYYLADRSYHSCIFLNSLASEDAIHQLLTVLNHLKGNHVKDIPIKFSKQEKSLLF